MMCRTWVSLIAVALLAESPAIADPRSFQKGSAAISKDGVIGRRACG
jgi:hypothetical protein